MFKNLSVLLLYKRKVRTFRFGAQVENSEQLTINDLFDTPKDSRQLIKFLLFDKSLRLLQFEREQPF